jgi:hypothetical protein
MKKIIFLSVIILLTVPAFSQDERDDGKEYFQQAITADIIHTLLGFFQSGGGGSIGYEYAPVQPAAVKASLCFLYSEPRAKQGGYFFMVNMEGRWYPMQRYVHGFFINGGYQFQRFSASLFHANTAIYNHVIHAGLGYKVIFTKDLNGFVLEPFFNYILPVSSDIPPGSLTAPERWLLGTGGFRAGLSLGTAL